MHVTNGAHGAVPARVIEVRPMAQPTILMTPEPDLGNVPPLSATRLGQVGNWLGRETLWSLDVFTRMVATIVILRTVSQLVTTWWFPRGVWDASPSLVRGFGGGSVTEDPAGEEAPEVDDADEEFVCTSDGYHFYRHARRHPGQRWECPLLYREPCEGCPWFVDDVEGHPRCAAILKLALHHHEGYRHHTLDDLRTLLEERRPGVFV